MILGTYKSLHFVEDLQSRLMTSAIYIPPFIPNLLWQLIQRLRDKNVQKKWLICPSGCISSELFSISLENRTYNLFVCLPKLKSSDAIHSTRILRENLCKLMRRKGLFSIIFCCILKSRNLSVYKNRRILIEWLLLHIQNTFLT